MSAYKIRTRGNYPEESTQHSEHGQSLKSRISGLFDHWRTQQGEPHPGSPPRSKIKKKTDFVGKMLSKVLCDLCLSLNQQLKLVSD